MAVKSFKPNLEGADLEKIKAVCYPCTSQNDCSRRLNNKQATVEECNGAYKLFDIDPPPVNYSPPKKVGTRRFERAQSRPSKRLQRPTGPFLERTHPKAMRKSRRWICHFRRFRRIRKERL